MLNEEKSQKLLTKLTEWAKERGDIPQSLIHVLHDIGTCNPNDVHAFCKEHFLDDKVAEFFDEFIQWMQSPSETPEDSPTTEKVDICKELSLIASRLYEISEQWKKK